MSYLYFSLLGSLTYNGYQALNVKGVDHYEYTSVCLLAILALGVLGDLLFKD